MSPPHCTFNDRIHFWLATQDDTDRDADSEQDADYDFFCGGRDALVDNYESSEEEGSVNLPDLLCTTAPMKLLLRDGNMRDLHQPTGVKDTTSHSQPASPSVGTTTIIINRAAYVPPGKRAGTVASRQSIDDRRIAFLEPLRQPKQPRSNNGFANARKAKVQGKCDRKKVKPVADGNEGKRKPKPRYDFAKKERQLDQPWRR